MPPPTIMAAQRLCLKHRHRGSCGHTQLLMRGAKLAKRRRWKYKISKRTRRRKILKMHTICTLMKRKGPVPPLLVNSTTFNIRHSKEGSSLQRRSTFREERSCFVLPIPRQLPVPCAPPQWSCQLRSSNVSWVILLLAVLIIRLLQMWASLPRLCSHQVTLCLP